MPIPHDYHLHSDFSCDCNHSMEAMIHGALARGLPEIGFTEHYDLHPRESCRDWLRFDAWWAALQRNRQAFEAQIVLRAGIEVGEPHRFADEARAALARFPFDYVLGSLHWVGDVVVFSPEFFEAPMDAAYRAYFEELERMTRAGGFDVLSHFDVVIRVGYEIYGEYDPYRYEDVIRAVLRNCIDGGIALDLNTAALRRRARRLTPGMEILRWYREMGGERLTLGSDAHRPENVGAGFEVAIEVARAAGFTHVMQYEARQPRPVPI